MTSAQGIGLGGLHGGAIQVGLSLKDVEDLAAWEGAEGYVQAEGRHGRGTPQ